LISRRDATNTDFLTLKKGRMSMRQAEIIKFDEDAVVVCPVCNALIIGEDGLSEQPSCEHVVYVFANAEAWRSG
jgi:hypothetical protein